MYFSSAGLVNTVNISCGVNHFLCPGEARLFTYFLLCFFIYSLFSFAVFCAEVDVYDWCQYLSSHLHFYSPLFLEEKCANDFQI